MIITLIGSARFEPWFKIWNEALSLAGHSVFTLSVYPSDKKGVREWYTEEDKEMLDAVHREKIRHSHAVVLINKFAYIGESTLREVEYARWHEVPVHPLESWGVGHGINNSHFKVVRDQAREYGVVAYGSPIDTTDRSPGISEIASFSVLLGPSGERRSRLVELVHSLDPDTSYKGAGTLS